MVQKQGKVKQLRMCYQNVYDHEHSIHSYLIASFLHCRHSNDSPLHLNFDEPSILINHVEARPGHESCVDLHSRLAVRYIRSDLGHIFLLSGRSVSPNASLDPSTDTHHRHFSPRPQFCYTKMGESSRGH